MSSVWLVKKRALLSATSNRKITSVRAVELLTVCHQFDFDTFYCLDMKAVLEKQEIVDNRAQMLRGLGDEFVVITIFSIE